MYQCIYFNGSNIHSVKMGAIFQNAKDIYTVAQNPCYERSHGIIETSVPGRTYLYIPINIKSLW